MYRLSRNTNIFKVSKPSRFTTLNKTSHFVGVPNENVAKIRGPAAAFFLVEETFSPADAHKAHPRYLDYTFLNESQARKAKHVLDYPHLSGERGQFTSTSTGKNVNLTSTFVVDQVGLKQAAPPASGCGSYQKLQLCTLIFFLVPRCCTRGR